MTVWAGLSWVVCLLGPHCSQCLGGLLTYGQQAGLPGYLILIQWPPSLASFPWWLQVAMCSKRVSICVEVIPKLLLVSCWLLVHWPKPVTTPDSRGREINPTLEWEHLQFPVTPGCSLGKNLEPFSQPASYLMISTSRTKIIADWPPCKTLGRGTLTVDVKTSTCGFPGGMNCPASAAT